jgi:hypothetical protein
VERLRSARNPPLVLLTAPAGYGKTTLLAEWDDRDSRPFAWLSIRPVHDDSAFLFACVVEALDRLEPVGAAVLDPLVAPAPNITGTALPLLQAALQGGPWRFRARPRRCPSPHFGRFLRVARRGCREPSCGLAATTRREGRNPPFR